MSETRHHNNGHRASKTGVQLMLTQEEKELLEVVKTNLSLSLS